jgi:DNA-binding PadR family transcriptional regulator
MESHVFSHLPTRTAARGEAASASLTSGQAAKMLMILGLLQSGPKHGYELHRIVVAHGALYADFKKPTLYHLLHRLALQGDVQEKSEAGARGRRGERLVFALTARGAALFRRLLRNALSSYDPTQIGFEVAIAFLASVPAKEAGTLLRKRRDVVRERRAEMTAEHKTLEQQPYSQRVAARHLATDHALSLMDTEIAWMDRAIRHVAATGQEKLHWPGGGRTRHTASA